MSTFASLNTALSGLRYNRVVLDTAANNIANASTPGYTRRRVEAEAVGAPVQPARWSIHPESGSGVRVSGITRTNDPFLDARARTEHGNQSYLDVRYAALSRVESGLGEPSDSGLSAAMAEFRQSWHDLANDPTGAVQRAQVLSKADAVAEALAGQVRLVEAEMGDQRGRLLSTVAEVNTMASELAAVNKGVAAAQLNNLDAGTLMDQRDALALRLAELTGGTATTNAQGGYDVTVGGVALVTGTVAGTLVVSSGVTPTGDADGSPVTFTVQHPLNGTTPVTVPLAGETGGMAELLTTTLPGHLAGLDGVARALADQVNAQHTAGYDAAGNPGRALFGYDPARPAATLALAVTDPALVAASSQPGGVYDGGNADAMAVLTDGENAFQRVVSGLGSQVASAGRLAANQQVLTGHVDAAREQQAGVSLDEEMLSMVTAQRGYEAAARVMTVLDSMLDTLINRTGLLR